MKMKLLIVLLITCFSLLNAQNLNPCFGVRDDTFFSHPRTPSKFLACFDGVLQEGSCPPGMEFDRIELHCDIPQSPTTTRRPNAGNICAGVPDETYLAHPYSQRKYIICVNGEILELDCPKDFPMFDPKELFCDHEVKVTTRSPPNRPTVTELPTLRTNPTRPSIRPTLTTRSPPNRPTVTELPTLRTNPTRPSIRPTLTTRSPPNRPTVTVLPTLRTNPTRPSIRPVPTQAPRS